MHRIAATALTTILAIWAVAPSRAQAPLELPDSAWREDLSYLVDTLEAVHPDLFARVDREVFEARAAAISAAIPGLTDQDIVVQLMQLVALVEDGHTSLEAVDSFGFGRWFPVRFFRFTDGIFVTAVAERYAELAGARVTQIGSMSAEEAWELSATLLGSDNEFGAMEGAPFHLCNAAALQSLGVIDDPGHVDLEVVLPDGETKVVRLDSLEDSYDLSFQFWSEIWGPASEVVTYVTPFGLSDDHYDEASDLPLHLRYRSAYWWYWDEAEKLFYVQISFMGNSGRRGQTFAEFNDSVFEAVDRHDVDTFVLDIRHNFGGNGGLVQQFVHEIIKRDEINRKGTLFTVVGRTTFSAGVMFAQAMEEHSETTFVGEPPGAYWASYGDGSSFELPHSSLLVWVSTIYHQLSSYAGDQRVLEIELPARFSSSDYLNGADPAIEQILASRTRPLIANVFRERGAEAALEVYEERMAEYGGVDWWAPFTLSSLNSLGHELLEADRYDDALAAYRLNARRHPEHWRVWYSLARAQQRHGDRDQAIENYERALAADPFNNLAPSQREALAELQGAVEGSSE